MMKTFSIALLVICCSATIVQAQNLIIDRQVIGSTGFLYNANNHNISATTGEVIITTESSASATLTQGFQQPSQKALIAFSVITASESCIGAANGTSAIENIAGCNPPYQVQWSNGSIGVTAANWSTGWHTVIVSNTTCQSEQSFFIGLNQDVNCELIIYTGITPNGDSDNDYWHIENIHLDRYKDNTVTIYNRWGDEVWKKENYDNQNVLWKGEGMNNQELPDGTYFYVLELLDKTYKGYIELTR